MSAPPDIAERIRLSRETRAQWRYGEADFYSTRDGPTCGWCGHVGGEERWVHDRSSNDHCVSTCRNCERETAIVWDHEILVFQGLRSPADLAYLKNKTGGDHA